MLESGLPSNMWDIALGVSTYIYNISPHKTLEMQAPIKFLAPNHRFDINQLRRFGCLAYTTIQNETKFKAVSIRTFCVGYLPTGYVVYHPETKKLLETRHVRFVEIFVYGDLYKEKLEELMSSRTDPKAQLDKATTKETVPVIEPV